MYNKNNDKQSIKKKEKSGIKKKVRQTFLTKELNAAIDNEYISEERLLKLYSILTLDRAKKIKDNPRTPIDIQRYMRIFLNEGDDLDNKIALDGRHIRARITKIEENRENTKIRMQEFRLKEKVDDKRVALMDVQINRISESEVKNLELNFNEVL